MEFSGINIEPDETEIERYDGDGLQAMVIDCGSDDDYVDELRDREFDVVVTPPDVPLTLFNHYEPKVIIYTDGENADNEWVSVSMNHFVRKVPIVAIGSAKEEMLDILGNATTGDGNNTDFGIYTFDDWNEDSVERSQYLAVHFNMQDNSYWDQ